MAAYALTLSLTAGAAILALAAQTPPERRIDHRAVDGEPTPQACSKYGFQTGGRDDDYRNRPYANRRMARAPSAYPAPPPPPPPPPPSPLVASAPPAATSVQELAVTGGRIAQPNLSRPMLPGPPPRTIETERYPDAAINAVRRVAEAPVSTFSIDVDTASYSNVRRFLNNGGLPPRDAVRVEELVNYFDYNYPRPPAAQTPFRPFVAVAPSPWAGEKEIIHIGLQGYDLDRGQQPPLNLVFLVDVSGSMSDDDKLPLAVQSLNVLIDRLRPQDRVSMAVYAGSAGAVLEPTAGYEKLKMRCALQSLHAGGSTAGGQGLALAYNLAERNFEKGSVNRVILMTDGDFNVGVADPEKLEDFVAEKRKTGVYLSVYGFGQGNYNDLMMQTLAQAGNGTAAYVDELDEAKKLFRTDFTSSLFPIADDVKIQVEFNPARVSEYRLIGYETRLLNREDFNNDRVDAGEVGAGAAVTALYEITPAGAPGAVDPLRYQSESAPAQATNRELAYLRIRYKLPGQPTSRLIERPIGDRDRSVSLAQAPESTRFALAVAAFGQRLRGDPWIKAGFNWRDIARTADGARGYDPDGRRAQFVRLADRAGSAVSVNE